MLTCSNAAAPLFSLRLKPRVRLLFCRSFSGFSLSSPQTLGFLTLLTLKITQKHPTSPFKGTNESTVELKTN